jgi:endonuclease/exonuclease/phosphatase family metal-dependent hydrolase
MRAEENPHSLRTLPQINIQNNWVTKHHWGFPSDHLPIVAEVHLSKRLFKILTFNLLNPRFADDRLKNQALEELINIDQKTNRNPFYLRWLQKKSIEIPLIGLQELNNELRNDLEQWSLSNTRYKVLWAPNKKYMTSDFGAIIYDSEIFNVSDSYVESYEISSECDLRLQCELSPIQDKYFFAVKVTHIETQEKFIFANTHVPFESVKSLTKIIKQITSQHNLPLILVGDFNTHLPTNPHLKEFAFKTKGIMYSHITTEKCLSLYDGVLIFNNQTSSLGFAEQNPTYNHQLHSTLYYEFNNKFNDVP